MKITVDREKCNSHAACVQLAPGTFHLDKEGIAVVVGQDAPHIVERAARACPVDAIQIEEAASL